MKKLQMSDLTPALLKEIKKLPSAQDVAAFLKEKEFEVSEKGAQKILDQLKEKAQELTDDELDKVSGGCFESSTTIS